MLKWVFITLGLLINLLAFSQQQNPSSIKWKQIKTDNFIFVFPQEVEDKGILTANLLETAFKPVRNSLKVSTPRTTVFLYNQSSISNGFSSLAPRQIVFYSTPPQDASLIGGTDWLQTLSIHEYRHAVQYAKLDNHFTNLIGGFFGNFPRVVLMNLSIPSWVFEGDAVCTETALSLEGRGRIPSFKRDIRALELENTRYNYYKAYLGSYKDYFPNYYHLGYLMTSHIRAKYGDQVWNKTLTRTTKFSFWPWTFSRSLKKYTRYSVQRTYNNTLDEYGSIWTDNQQKVIFTEFERVEMPETKVYTNYTYPFFTSNGKIVAKKSGMADAPQLVLLDNGKETSLTGINTVDRLHSNGNMVVWTTEVSDIRWGQRSYADIVVYDINSNKKKRLTKKGKYYAPAVSPNGELIVAVKYNHEMKCQLVFLDSKNGNETNSLNIPDDSFLRMPSWSKDGKKIVFTITKGQERKISIFDINTNSFTDVTDFSIEGVTNPVFYEDFVLYNSPVSGVDAIYAINISTKEKYYVVTGDYGTYNPSFSVDNSKMIFQDYTTMGEVLESVDVKPDKWRKLENIEYAGDKYYENIVKLEKGTNIFDSLEHEMVTNYEIKKYRPLLHSVDLIGWALYPVPNGVGFGVLSNDKLNTTYFTAGINYFPDARAHREFINMEYSRFFPVVQVMAHYGRLYGSYKDTSDTYQYRQEDEKVLRGGLMFPFNFSRGIHTTSMELNAAYNSIFYKRQADSLFESPEEYKEDITALELGFKFLHFGQQAKRDLNPRFGQILNVAYWSTPFGTGTEGERLVGNGTLYFPGLAKHHGISLIGGYEKSSSSFREGVYKLTTGLEFVRGYTYDFADEFIKGTFVYSLPLAYPDFALGPILYCQRISAGAFYDYGLLRKDNKEYSLSSVGLDLNFNLNLFSHKVQFEIGLRTSYLIEKEGLALEFVLLGAYL